MNAPIKTPSSRILSIDIMRGFTLVLMLFVNDLYVSGVPEWMVHTKANFDGMGLADWVFPGFLFMVGMAIPFAIQNRLKRGDNKGKILFHILVRTFSLLAIGILMVNSKRINSDLTIIGKNLWAILMYVCVFLIWNNYSKNKKKLAIGLKSLGILGLAILLFIYKGGTAEEPTWIILGWWGILGLIGWGYFAASVTYLYAGNNLLKIFAVWLFVLALHITSKFGMLGFLEPVKPIFGVLIDGNVPFVVLSGLLVSLIMKRFSNDHKRLMTILFTLSVLSFAFGFVLRNWFIISKGQGTPSWTFICNGISIGIFLILYYVLDVKKWVRWSNLLKPAGQNSLTTYLAPDILYYAIWGLSLPILFYKQDASQLLAVGGSIVWALTMVGLAALLAKMHIRLKL